MAVETALYIQQLNPLAPVGTDFLYEADDQFRNLKVCLTTEFPGFTASGVHVLVSQAQLNTVIQAITVPEANGFAIPTAAVRKGAIFGFDATTGAADFSRTFAAFDASVVSASTSANTATTQANNATTQANNAGTSATNSATAAVLAMNWATSLSLVDGTYYGARKYAIDAANSATAAASSATTAASYGAGSLNVVLISTNTAGTLGNLYVFTGNCTLTLPTTTDASKRIGWCNATGAAGPVVDFGTSKCKGYAASPGLMTLDSGTAAAVIQWSGNATQGWVQT